MNGAVKSRDLAYVSGFYFTLLTNGAGCGIILVKTKLAAIMASPNEKPESRELSGFPLFVGPATVQPSAYVISDYTGQDSYHKTSSIFHGLTSPQSEVPTHIFYHNWFLKSI